MRAAAIRWLAVLAVGAGALAAVLYTASTVDRRPPQVSAYELTQHLTGDARAALTTTSIEVTFNEAVDHASAQAAFEIDPAMPGGFSWSGVTMIFTPAERLPTETHFEVRVRAGVLDLAGNAMPSDADPFAFATVGPPAVVASEPIDGAEEVALDAPIVLTFSTLMDTASVEAALRLEPRFRHELRWSGERLAIVPTEPLDPGRSYQVELGPAAVDQGGITLAEPFAFSFLTLPPGLAALQILPADGTDGIAVTTPLAVIFDRAVDPDTLQTEMLRIEPPVAGSVELVARELPDDPDEGEARILRFVPAGDLPANTTFSVEIMAGLRATDGGALAAPLTWTFTTGSPLSTLSNQIVFLTERAGVANLWSMNPFDGTGKRQLSVELRAVLDYAVSSDGRFFVVSDGLRLITYRADGRARRVLTAPEHVEFDPTLSPDGQRIAFARADAQTGEPLGIWERSVDAGDAETFELPAELGASPTPATEEGAQAAPLLRSPRYSPDWSALAFVDVTNGRVGVLELPRERLVTAAFRAVSPPSWSADSSELLIGGLPEAGRGPQRIEVGRPVPPLDPDELAAAELGELQVATLRRGATSVEELEPAAIRPVHGPIDRIAYVLPDGDDAAGRAWIDGPRMDGHGLPDARDVRRIAFGPEAEMLIIERARGIWLWALSGDELTRLSADGYRPRWQP